LADQATLWGADHVELGEIAVEPVGERGAIALSRGAEPKVYYSVEPNEDAVAGAVGPRSTLLAVADGHDGYESVPAALGSILDALGDDPPPADLSDGEVVDLFTVANEAALSATGGGYADDESSRTTLVVALLTASRLQWASFGDSALLTSSAEGTRTLGTNKLLFIGYPMQRSNVAELLDRGSLEMTDGSWVVAASDGLMDYAGGRGVAAQDAIGEVMRSEATPPNKAELLVRAAFGGGAGDNVAVALSHCG
jgi:serine/threonine protein phosphatase PrpC